MLHTDINRRNDLAMIPPLASNVIYRAGEQVIRVGIDSLIVADRRGAHCRSKQVNAVEQNLPACCHHQTLLRVRQSSVLQVILPPRHRLKRVIFVWRIPHPDAQSVPVWLLLGL